MADRAAGRIPGWRALLRTNLGRAAERRREIIHAHAKGAPLGGESWRDIPMRPCEAGWDLELPSVEVGFFKAKAYLVDPQGWQHWPSGQDVGISVHPDFCRSANLIYCAFTRMFGGTRSLNRTDPSTEAFFRPYDAQGYTVIPPSGKFRDLKALLPHVFDTLGCRILHLLPVHPTPTTYARFGRYGSPYAALDLTAIDPALVEFDKRTTGVDQFKELAYAVHLRGGRLFLDIVINHTGWGSVHMENHPEWFLRHPDGQFASPGAWGTVWEDLVELHHKTVELWDELAKMFLVWCRRGVDGFRCDAGYKVPVAAWQYIIARVQEEYPSTVFLLEGLGGAWDSTEALLTEGGMQWAYSEMFQNYTPEQVSGYLDHHLRQSERVGLLVHYSETHDNARLAAKGRAWSLLRNRLCALSSVSGGFGFTCGVEWLASEKVLVHGSTGMNWGSDENLLPELSRLNRLLAEHPCFFDGASIKRLSGDHDPILVLHRKSADGQDEVLVLVNTDATKGQFLPISVLGECGKKIGDWVDLLGQKPPPLRRPGGTPSLSLPAASAYCLGPALSPAGVQGMEYRHLRSLAAFAVQALNQVMPCETIHAPRWNVLARMVDRAPQEFLASASYLGANPSAGSSDASTENSETAIETTFNRALRGQVFPNVIPWGVLDAKRVTPVPPNHWLLVTDQAPFRCSLAFEGNAPVLNVESVQAAGKNIACFPPTSYQGLGTLLIERYAETETHRRAAVLFLGAAGWTPKEVGPRRPTDLALLTNGRGGMCRMLLDLGRIESKYDCVLGANLDPVLPVDRHVFVKRFRVWVNADGFISPLDFRRLVSFNTGNPAVWDFVASAGDGRTVQLRLAATMMDGSNTVAFRFSRPAAANASGKQLPSNADVRLTVRFDLEDRNFHQETKRNGGADFHFNSHTHTLEQPNVGFEFVPTPERRLRVVANVGAYHPQPEWSENVPHSIEQTRGQEGYGDAYSPGWFEIPLPKGASATLTASAEPDPKPAREQAFLTTPAPEAAAREAEVEQTLLNACRAFLVQREDTKTIIAGYPWFLDWGRDTLICARGLIAGGMLEEVKQLLITFARFEENGTLPNTIHGQDASNRDTTDAPLWFAVAVEELATTTSSTLYDVQVRPDGRTIGDTVRNIARGYMAGTPNGIRMDPDSALIWSPSHFTWMDTNHPACTPREGYPIEIQALWIRLLQQLAARHKREAHWKALAEQAQQSLETRFWLPEEGWYSDLLKASANQRASSSVADDALRSNCLIPISLGLLKGERAKSCVAAAQRYLVVPAALRTLAPLPVRVPQPITARDGRPLNDPHHPYWGRYEGDEDTRRKPAYHNGSAWTWTFPIFCEALVRAWDSTPEAISAAKAYLFSITWLLYRDCLGHLPELVDGDAPHAQRGCDAQAWSATEALRVLRMLQR